MTGTRKVPTDPELFDAGLDFYFGAVDSISGLRGIPPRDDGCSLAIAKNTMHAPKGGSETITWSHKAAQTLPSKSPDAMTDHALRGVAFGRKVWAALSRVPWPMQQLLARYYGDAFALAAAAGQPIGPPRGALISEAEVRAAHRAYLAVAAGAAEPPMTIDRDVSGDATGRAKYRERGEAPRSDAERKRAERARNEVDHGAGSRRAERYGREDSAERIAQEKAEPLVCSLRPGRNEYPEAQFQALAKYFLDGDAEQRRAIKRGQFATAGGRIEIVRVSAEFVSLREYARRSGMARTTLMRKVVHLDLPSKKVGQEKQFVIEHLDRAMRVARKL